MDNDVSALSFVFRSLPIVLVSLLLIPSQGRVSSGQSSQVYQGVDDTMTH